MPFYKTKTKPKPGSLGFSVTVLIEARTKYRAQQVAREKELYVSKVTEAPSISAVYHDKEG